MNKTFLLLIASLVAVIFFSCKEKKVTVRDFEQIKNSRKLTVLTISSSTSYFLYKDEPMGYEFDLVKDFCNHYGLAIEVKVADNMPHLVDMLLKKEGDLVITPITVQNSLKDSVIYCGLERVSHQVLVQRSDIKDSILTDVTQLIGKEVYVKEGTPYAQRVVNLNSELGGGINLKYVEKDTVTVEDLIEMVSLHHIDYTIADDYVAMLNKTYYSNINTSLAISFEQRSSWIVRKDEPLLAKALDEWFADVSQKQVFDATVKKYFELSKRNVEDMPTELPNGAISTFDNIFKKYAKVSGYDWYLLAAIAYQESRFTTDRSSWAGAKGLMGLMPRTARSLGISGDDLYDPDLSVMAGANLIKRLNSIFTKIQDKGQKVKFVLAAYNGGNGHVSDAQALAKKYGDDPYSWDNSVEKYIALKSKPEYYNDPVCKNGYLRSQEVLNYVSNVVTNWEKFKNEDITE